MIGGVIAVVVDAITLMHAHQNRDDRVIDGPGLMMVKKVTVMVTMVLMEKVYW